MIRNLFSKSLERTLQIKDNNEIKKADVKQEEKLQPKQVKNEYQVINAEANANDIIGMQNLSMISYNNKKLQEKAALETKYKEDTNLNSLTTPKAKTKALEETKANAEVKTNFRANTVTSRDVSSKTNANEPSIVENPDKFLKDGFSIEMFSDETNLEKIFPPEKYNIEEIFSDYTDDYKITDKDGNEILTIQLGTHEIYKNCVFFEFTDNNGVKRSYKTRDGILESYELISSDKTKGYYPDGKLFFISDHKNNSHITYNPNGSCIYKRENGIETTYNSDGSYVQEESNGKKTFYNSNGIVTNVEHSLDSFTDLIKDEIHKTNWIGIPETSDNLNESIKSYINKDNVMEFLKKYEAKTNEDIFEAVFDELGLSGEEKAEIALYLKDQIMEHYKAQGVYTDDIDSNMTTYINYQARKIGFMNSGKISSNKTNFLARLNDRKLSGGKADGSAANGKIDQEFLQGYTGDCWLLSSIKAIASNDETLAILNDMISVDENGNVTVTLKHLDKTYHISKEELNGADELSRGDLDVRALEIAVNRYMNEGNYITLPSYLHGVQDIDEGNQLSVGMQLLLGVTNISDNLGGFGILYDMITLETSLIDDIKSGKYIAVCNVKGDEFVKCSAETTNGKKIDKLYTNHAYSIVGADEKFIYIVNPHNTSETLKFTHEEFKKCFTSGAVFSVDEIKEKNPINNIPDSSQNNDNKFETKNENKTNNTPTQEEIPTIDGGELPEVIVTGEAGDEVTVKDGHTFIAVTDEQGNVNYRVRDQEGNVSYVSQEVFDKLIKNGKDDVKNVLNDYAVKNSEDVSEELVGFDWTNDAKANIENELKEKYGDYQFSVAYNFDGTYTFAIFDSEGRRIDPDEALKKANKEPEDNPVDNEDTPKLPGQTGWSGIYGQSILGKYGNPDGSIDTDILIGDWGANGGEIYDYEGEDAEEAMKTLKDAQESGDYSGFWATYGSDKNHRRGGGGGGYNDGWSSWADITQGAGADIAESIANAWKAEMNKNVANRNTDVMAQDFKRLDIY